MKKAILAASVLLALAGCATYRPIVDTQGVNMVQYEQDLSACQAYATQVSPAGGAAAGAVIGALFGIATSAILGGNYMGQSAGIGALYGASGGAAHGAGSQVSVVRNCMAGRGYRVLN